jgi:hypothetical protein
MGQQDFKWAFSAMLMITKVDGDVDDDEGGDKGGGDGDDVDGCQKWR